MKSGVGKCELYHTAARTLRDKTHVGTPDEHGAAKLYATIKTTLLH